VTAFLRPSLLILAMGAPASGAGATADLSISAEELDACRRGERAALDRVFRAHASVLERLLARLVGPHGDVEDLLQETFIAAIHAFPRFRGEASVRSWLHRIAVHVAHKELRRPRRRREAPIEMLGAEIAGNEASTTDRIAASQLANALYRHLDKLDARKRIAIVLHVVEGYSVAEIAALTGASQTATKSRLFWARRALLASMHRDPSLDGEVPR
jgi:RNA polymerase sigma-70 factor (ECF subfamily)